MDPTKCFICKEPFKEGDTEFVGKGIQSLILASKARKDGKHEQLEHLEIVQVHKSCKLDYTNKDSIKMFNHIAKESKNQQKTVDNFDFRNKCLFCEVDVKVEAKKSLNRRRRIHTCTQPGLKEKILECAAKRNDELGNQVLNRIKNVDLLALKAHYHKDCNLKFFYAASKLKKGRPEDQTLNRAFEKVCDYINSSEERQFTLKSLLEKVEDNLPDNGTMSMKTLKSKLEKKYGDGIVFAISLIKPSVIYFLDSGLKQREEFIKQPKTEV